jgi:acid stress-induced BolA-like protein IbaG/YrbA
MLEDVIYQAIDQYLNCEHLDVTGDGQHFEATVVSDDFMNQSRVQRHRLVYESLGEKMKSEVHALSMKLYTITEWDEING